MLVLCGGRGIQLCKQRSPWKDNTEIPYFPSFFHLWSCEGRGVGAGTARVFAGGGQGSLWPGISTFTPLLDLAFLWNSKLHSPPLPVCLSTWVENRQTGSPTDFHSAGQRGKKTTSTEGGFPLAPARFRSEVAGGVCFGWLVWGFLIKLGWKQTTLTAGFPLSPLFEPC